MKSALEEWDNAAANFDDEPDHGLRDPAIRSAWAALLMDHLPAAPSRVLDVGCGTGSLSVLLASLGHAICGLDSSWQMLARARAKAARAQVGISFIRGDAADPPVSGPFDVILCRHVLWALPSPGRALEHWRSLLRPAGQLLLIEGLWYTGAGLRATDLVPLVDSAIGPTRLRRLTDPALWGHEIDDERYLLSATG